MSRYSLRSDLFRRLAALVLATSDLCHLCCHPGADTIDHLYPLSWQVPGIDPYDITFWRPAHHKPWRSQGVSATPPRVPVRVS
jgi:hypothetical protein